MLKTKIESILLIIINLAITSDVRSTKMKIQFTFHEPLNR